MATMLKDLMNGLAEVDAVLARQTYSSATRVTQ